MSMWLPLLVTVVAGISGLVGYAWQRSIDRRNALIELRRKEYAALLDQLVRTFISPDTVPEFNAMRMRLAAIASDQVLRKLSELAMHTSKTRGLSRPDSVKEFKNHLAELIIAMRIDCFEMTTLDPNELSAILPIEDK